ncbi:methionine synthase [Solicola sp. PLA-1-18]|uniref:methionine synthase n=1 Tax=Solicola sp. PLA-1-18 TaxID=3380532 RepID=UPI003B778457
MTATLVGSLPGTDVREAVRMMVDLLPDLTPVPELPGRGAGAEMVGRTAALLVDLGVDLQPAGWRLTDAPGVDHRRARSLLAADLDVVEEEWQGHQGTIKTQVAGPWTLVASIERPRGDRVLADHGARREVAESLAEGVALHVADLQRRVPGADVVVQVDEPGLTAVLAGAIRTASGFSRHRVIHAPEADALLRLVVDAVRRAGATPVLHSCAPRVPVALVAGAGFAGYSFDLDLLDDQGVERWAQAHEDGLAPWIGVVPSTAADADPSVNDLASRTNRFLDRIGAAVVPGVPVVTATCGLAGATPAWARRAARLVTQVDSAVVDSA